MVLNDDAIAAEHERLTTLGVTLTQAASDVRPLIVAVFDDT